MNLIHKKSKGFTLIEILLVIALISMVATVAISTYFSSSRTLSFLADYQELNSVFRGARSYAILNKKEPSIESSRYGVRIEVDSVNYNVKLFADNDKSAYVYNSVDPNKDVDYPNKSYSFPRADYTIGVKATGSSTSLNLPITVFYEGESGKVTVVDSLGAVLPKSSVKSLEFEMKTRSGSSIVKKLILYQVSGLTESK